MPFYEYECDECGTREDIQKPMSCSHTRETCQLCGRRMRKTIGVLRIIGTRDSFGIKQEFVDPESGKVIDTWPKWEQAGYKEAKSIVRKKGSQRANEAFKKKKDKLKNKVTV